MADTTNARGGKSGSRKQNKGQFSKGSERAKEAGRKGGRAAHKRGTAHTFTPEEAREAGRKGGRASRRGRSQS